MDFGASSGRLYAAVPHKPAAAEPVEGEEGSGAPDWNYGTTSNPQPPAPLPSAAFSKPKAEVGAPPNAERPSANAPSE